MSEEQVEQIIDDAFDELLEDSKQGVIKSLEQIEKAIFEEHGDPEETGEVWAVISTADRDGTDPFEEDKIEVKCTGKGPDLYAGLQNRELAVIHSLLEGKIGTMIRSGAWMSPTGSELRPSDHPEKKSCIITCSYLANHVFFVMRFEDGKVETLSMNQEDYMEGRAGGQQRLVDALLDFEHLPTALQEHEPEIYAEILEAIQERMKEQDTE